ncbi:unnamed protein product [Effrenium voratum]|nr:unnamed protein product [Effrenium voratum]
MGPDADDLPVGAVVRLVNLQRAEFNHHLGRVVAPLESGRVGVVLHGVISQKAAYEPLSFKVENLRRVPSLPSLLPVLDSIGPRAVRRLLGDVGWGLPENVAVQVASFLQIRRLQLEEVQVTGCSSHRGDFPISAALNDREDEWWISDSGTCPGGQGAEFLEFRFAARRRVFFAGLKIPPLPMGPLSVREFHLMVPSGEDWVCATPPMQTLNRGDMQEFALPPLECQSLRLMCTKNAAAAEAAALPGFANCIGLFQVSFA